VAGYRGSTAASPSSATEASKHIKTATTSNDHDFPGLEKKPARGFGFSEGMAREGAVGVAGCLAVAPSTPYRMVGGTATGKPVSGLVAERQFRHRTRAAG
jgi:hypothetical protein